MPGVVEANLMIGFAWNDRPWVGITALITSCDGLATARAHVARLARRVWEARQEFVLRMWAKTPRRMPIAGHLHGEMERRLCPFLGHHAVSIAGTG